MLARVDLVIFGASGFTGRVAVYQILKLVKDRNITWGIAGRSASKLQDILKDVSSKTGESLKKIPVIVADVNDAKSLSDMASKARVVVNCVGPYRFYGEPVVKACIENGTHHVDVSGEPQYMEQMQLKYNKAAEEKGSYIVNACGLSGMPADIGLIHLIQKFNGDLNSMEMYIEPEKTSNSENVISHFGTWESAIYSLKHTSELKTLRRKLFPQRLPTSKTKLLRRSLMHKSKLINKWSLPFPGADMSVMYRSQRYLYEREGGRPVQVATYIGLNSMYGAASVAFYSCMFAAMTKTTFTRKLLLKYPEFFSRGLVSRDGPTQASKDDTVFKITLHGEGWTQSRNIKEVHRSPLNKSMALQVKIRDPGYGFTTTSVLLAAITILKESDKMPGWYLEYKVGATNWMRSKRVTSQGQALRLVLFSLNRCCRGGVLSPGAAFARTSLIRALAENGLKYEIIKEDLRLNYEDTDLLRVH